MSKRCPGGRRKVDWSASAWTKSRRVHPQRGRPHPHLRPRPHPRPRPRLCKADVRVHKVVRCGAVWCGVVWCILLCHPPGLCPPPGQSPGGAVRCGVLVDGVFFYKSGVLFLTKKAVRCFFYKKRQSHLLSFFTKKKKANDFFYILKFFKKEKIFIAFFLF
jgi:hypothetical protein